MDSASACIKIIYHIAFVISHKAAVLKVIWCGCLRISPYISCGLLPDHTFVQHPVHDLRVPIKKSVLEGLAAF
jgi:hypothetical protein